MDGLEVWRVNGKKLEEGTIRVGSDKFTIHIDIKRQKTGFFLRRVSSAESAHHDASGNSIAKDSSKRVIDVGAIDRIQRGQTSIIGKGSRRQNDSNVAVLKNGSEADGQPGRVSPERSFSIIFHGERQVDLLAADPMDRDEILDGLNHIILTYQDAKASQSKTHSCFIF